MSFSFNLVDEPFIPCVLPDGTSAELGLRETLQRAPDIREVRDASPLVTAALHRLLLAILHRNFGPANLKAWKRLWQAGRFDPGPLADYWQRCRGRFDLFDSTQPFYQTAGFRTKEPSSVSRLFHELASGNNATLFDHTLDDNPPALTPAVAARLVIAHQSFAIGGGKSETGYTSHAPLIQGAVVFPQGDTLFETLLLNLIAYNADEPFPAKNDTPVWERGAESPTQGPPAPAGYLDYLTWQSRTLALQPESDEGRTVVRRVFYAQGRKLDAPNLTDPAMAYRKDENLGWRAIRLSDHRELWRDSGALFQLTGNGQGKRPDCFNWLARLVADGALLSSQRYDFAVYGLCSDKAKVNFWRADRMPLPLAYLNDAELVSHLQQALQQAEDVGKALREAVWRAASLALAPTTGKADKDRVSDLVESLAPGRLYWSRLEVPFRQFMVRLASSGEAADAEVARWVCEVLAREARAAFEGTVGRMDHSARVLRAVTGGRFRLGAGLNTITGPYLEVLHEQTA